MSRKRKHWEVFDLSKYRQWRASVPFTDEQIAEQLEKDADAATSPYLAKRWRWMAASCRKGFVGKAALGVTLGALVHTCEFCPKKALYRWASKGRCKDHRMISDVGVEASRLRREQRNVFFDEMRDGKERAAIGRDATRHQRRGERVRTK